MAIAIPNTYLQAQQAKDKIWAQSYLHHKAPQLQLRRWWQDKAPEKGAAKAMLLVLWTPEDSQSKALLKQLNEWQRAMSHEMNVVALTAARAAAIKKVCPQPCEIYIGIDPQGHMQGQMRVSGLPHALLIDAKGVVQWEGYPFAYKSPLSLSLMKKLLQ